MNRVRSLACQACGGPKVGAIVGSGFAAGAYTVPGVGPVSDEVTLAADGPAEIYAGERSIRRFARGEQLALRVFDPAAEGRRGLRAIAAYEPDVELPQLRVRKADRVEREIELAERVHAVGGDLWRCGVGAGGR